MTPHDTIRSARQAKAMSQATLAEAAGLSERTVKRAEGGHAMSPETAQALASVLDIPVAVLVREDVRPARAPLVETLLSPEALAADPRYEVLQAILASGQGTHVVVPDPGTLKSFNPWVEKAEARSRLWERGLLASTAPALLSLILLPFSARGNPVFGYCLALLAASAVMAYACYFLHRLSRCGLKDAWARTRFAEQCLVVVDGDDFHVVRVDHGTTTRSTHGTGRDVRWSRAIEGPMAYHLVEGPGECILVSGVPASSALDRFAAALPGASIATDGCDALVAA